MQQENYLHKLKDITTIVFDVDGVLTNGMLIATDNGELWRLFNAKDGFALKIALERGYNLCIITGGTSEGVALRFKKLGFKHIYYKVNDKVKVLREFVVAAQLKYENILYIGDDIPDYDAMKLCAIACCPNDAVPEIKQISDYIATKNGGNACVREIIEMVLKVQDKWFNLN